MNNRWFSPPFGTLANEADGIAVEEFLSAGVDSSPTPAEFQETDEATTLNASMTSPASADL